MDVASEEGSDVTVCLRECLGDLRCSVVTCETLTCLARDVFGASQSIDAAIGSVVGEMSQRHGTLHSVKCLSVKRFFDCVVVADVGNRACYV